MVKETMDVRSKFLLWLFIESAFGCEFTVNSTTNIASI